MSYTSACMSYSKLVPRGHTGACDDPKWRTARNSDLFDVLGTWQEERYTETTRACTYKAQSVK